MTKSMIDTKIYDDAWFFALPNEAKWLFIFLLTNKNCNLIGCYEIPLPVICAYTGLTSQQLTIYLEKIKDKVIYFDGWIIIKNYSKYNFMRNPSIEESKNKQYNSLPQKIKETLDTGCVHPVDTDNVIVNVIGRVKVKGNVKGNVNVNGGTKNKKLDDLSLEDILEVATDYQVTEAFVRSKIDDIRNYCASKGKNYLDYKATLRNWVKRDAIERKEGHNGKSKITVISPDPDWKTP